ncbi:MAG: hypothetical protein ACRDNY_00065 [Gaiellaceae bacterium]
MTELVGLLLLLVGAGGLVGGATLATCCLRLRSPIEFLLAAYVVSWTWLVFVVLALSPARLLTRSSLLLGIGIGLVAALATWLQAGRPGPPSFRAASSTARDALRHPAVLVLAVTVFASLVYSLALALATPLNDWDVLSYHATRAAFWKQQHGVGYIQDTADLRLNANPPNAEIGQLATMLLSGNDRYAALVQLVAYGTLLLGVADMARRIGLHAREAVFAALAVSTLPVLVLQASGGLNDLVVASFLVAAAYFATGSGRTALVLVALAVALAIGTKFTGLLALPTLAVVAAAGRGSRDWLKLGLAGVAGLGLGSVWYVVNLAETADLDGGQAEVTDQRAEVTFSPVVTSALRLTASFLDMSGAGGAQLVFVGAAGVLALLGALRLGRARREGGTALLAAAVITALWPLALPAIGDVGLRAVYKIWILTGQVEFAWFEGDWSVNTLAEPTISSYGPLAPILLAAGAGVVVWMRVQRRLPPLALALAAAPWLLVLTLALTVVWDPFRSRFLILGVALAGATWGVLLRSTALAAITAAIGSTTLLLVLANHALKPSGLADLTFTARESIWRMPRWDAQALAQPITRDAFRFVEERVPADAHIGIAFPGSDFIYPYFGRELRRHVTLISARGGAVPPDAAWLVLGWRAVVRRCPSAWDTEVGVEPGLRVERRIGPDVCERE